MTQNMKFCDEFFTNSEKNANCITFWHIANVFVCMVLFIGQLLVRIRAHNLSVFLIISTVS